MLKEIFDIIEKKERPAFSKLIYILNGIIILIELFLKIAPFRISITFLENLAWIKNINDNSKIVNGLFWVWIIYVVSLVLKKFIMHHYSKASDDEFRKACIMVHSVYDVLDFIVSLFSFVFVLFVAIQIHKTEFVLLTGKAIFIYVMIMLQFFDFIFFRIYYKNKKVVWNSLKG